MLVIINSCENTVLRSFLHIGLHSYRPIRMPVPIKPPEGVNVEADQSMENSKEHDTLPCSAPSSTDHINIISVFILM